MEIKIRCECGADLDVTNYVAEFGGFTAVVEKCEDCKQTAYDEGRDDGYQEGKDEFESQTK